MHSMHDRGGESHFGGWGRSPHFGVSLRPQYSYEYPPLPRAVLPYPVILPVEPQQYAYPSPVFVNPGLQPAQYVQQPPVRGPGITPSFGTLIILACIVTFFCGVLFGLVALLLAVCGRERVVTGDYREAHRLGTASLWVSIAGILVGLTVIIATAVSMTSHRP